METLIRIPLAALSSVGWETQWVICATGVFRVEYWHSRSDRADRPVVTRTEHFQKRTTGTVSYQMNEASRLRRAIAWHAAKLMYDQDETEYYRAKMKAARKLAKGWVKPVDLPSNAEIRDEVQRLARQIEGESRQVNLREMRFAALALMRKLRAYHPKLIGSVLTGHVRQGSDIDIHVFSDSLSSVTAELDYHGIVHDTQRKVVRKQGTETVYRHIHIHDRFPFELTVYPTNMRSHVFRSSITGGPMERASIAQLEQLLEREYPDVALEEEIRAADERPDRFQVFTGLLLPLENVIQNPQYHPEGDVLYHSLQVFDLALDQRPWDEEFLLAALLHDVGKGIDPRDHVNAGLEALEGTITERTRWLIENHMLAHKIHDGSIGARKHRRLRENENYDDLILLGQIDRAGRQTGVETTDLDDALEYIRSIADQF